jgi:hypothetical protein
MINEKEDIKAVTTRLDRIAHLLLDEQKRESEDVATDMKRLKRPLPSRILESPMPPARGRPRPPASQVGGFFPPLSAQPASFLLHKRPTLSLTLVSILI